MAFGPGDVVGNRYRLLEKLGAGAHGVVFRARDLETREEVALKFLGDGKSLDPEYCRRIEREALAMARLRGTSAVYVHGLNLAHDGSLYLVMEVLAGRDFEAYLSEAERIGGRLKKPKLLELLRPIVDTLEAAHQQGIVHRDLKPSNVFIVDPSRGGGVRLLDFGLAKVLDASALTADGMVAGTPSYIAPEAWRGISSILDHRIDVYALGVLVFELWAVARRRPKAMCSRCVIGRCAANGRAFTPFARACRARSTCGWKRRSPSSRATASRASAALWSALEGLLAERAKSPY